jgi:hypothetical protein
MVSRTWLVPCETYAAAAAALPRAALRAFEMRPARVGVCSPTRSSGTTATPVSLTAGECARAADTLARARAGELGRRHRRGVLAVVLGRDNARAEHGRGEPRGDVRLDGVGDVCARTLSERRLRDRARRAVEQRLGLRNARLRHRARERADAADLLVRARAGELIRGQGRRVEAVVLRRRDGRAACGSTGCRTLSDRAQNSAIRTTYAGTRQRSA